MAEEKKGYPLSYPQKSVWHLEKMYPQSSIGNIAAALKIHLEVDYKAMNRAFNHFIKMNDAIRIRIKENEDGEPEQYVSAFTYRDIEIKDFSNRDIRELYEWDSKITHLPFYQPDSDLFYFVFLKTGEKSGGFYVKLHHLIADAWTLVGLGNEIMRYYKAIISGEELPEEEKPSYIDYLISEKKYLASARFVKDQDFWMEKFSNIPELTTLKERKPGDKHINATRKTFLLPAKLCGKIRRHCTEHRTSIFALFFGALAIYMNRTRGEREIIFGTPVLNRSNAREKDIMGMFISTVPIHIKVDDSLDYISFSDAINQEWRSVLRHQKYPYPLLLQKLREKHPGLEKLYDIVISYQNAKFLKDDPKSQEGRWYQNGCQTHSLSIHINDREDDGDIVVDYDYLTHLFYPREIEFLHDHVIRLLWHAIDNPLRKLPLIEMISEREKKKILHDFNNTTMEYPKDKTVVDLFVEQVNRTPDKLCCIAGEEQITYRQLNKRANRLAGYLREKGIKRDDIVGVLMHRSIDLIVTLMGILKAGGAYLPMDHDFPKDRSNMILKDCHARLLITDSKTDEMKAPCDILRIDETSFLNNSDQDVPPDCKPESLIYVIYTSGSTGKPKGVMVEHHNVVNLIYGIRQKIDYRNKTVLSKTSVSFDVFVLDSWLPLVCGSKIVLTNDAEQKNSNRINHLIIKHQVNIIHSVPSRLKDMLLQSNSHKAFESLTDITTGGEVLTVDLLERLRETTQAKIYNVYGPTETTVYSTFYDTTDKNATTIGKPIGNTRVYILDKHMHLLPIGVPGELCISGDGVTRGYMNLEEMTKEKFVQNPFDKTQRMYKTGDIARWYPEGEIAYIGRKDAQVKIRGVRIELGEVEKEILKHKGVNEVVVTDKQEPDGKKVLCAYLIHDSNFSYTRLKAFLSDRLPKFMIPSFFIRIDKIPLTSNGKIDRERLPAVDKYKIAEKDYKTPETATEKGICLIWKEILSVDLIGQNSNFFELGGDSLNVVIFQNRIHKKFNVEISIEKIYELPTVTEISEYIDSIKTNRFIGIPKTKLQAYYPLSPAQRRIYLSAGLTEQLNYNTPFALSLHGNITHQRVEQIFKKLIQRHESLRTSFHIVNGEPVQKVHENVSFSVDVFHPLETNVDQTLHGLIKPFALDQAPLLRIAFLELESHQHILFIDTHHVICDGISMDILLDEFLAIYDGKQLDKSDIRYVDYAVWKNNMLRSEDILRQEKYWLDLYQGDIPVLDMPLDYERPQKRNFVGKMFKSKLDNKLGEKIKQIKKEDGITPFMVFLAAYHILLSKYTHQEDIVVGTATAGRNHPEIENLTGMFINTLALRNKPEAGKTFKQFLYEVRDNVIGAFQNQDYPFEELVAKLKTARDLNRNPLFDTMLTFRRMDKAKTCEKLAVSQYDIENHTSKFDVLIEIREHHNAFDMIIEYDTELYKEETIKRMAKHFIQVLHVISTNATVKLSDIDILPKEERSLVLNAFNNTAQDYQRDKPIHRWFEEQVEKTPDTVAFIFEEREYTYRKLNQSANRLAWYLREKGIKPNEIVGIMLKRSFELIVAIFGILKSGGCYLPIDPDYPEERIQYILNDSRAKMILTEGQFIKRIADGAEAMDMGDFVASGYSEDNPPLVNCGTDLSYVIYTSGSTGRPKGAMLRHDSLVNLSIGLSNYVGMKPGRKIISLTTISFDIFAFETFLPLVNGMGIIFTNEEQQRLPGLQAELIQLHHVDYLQTTPSRMDIIINSQYHHEILKPLKDIVLIGEVFSHDLYLKMRKHTNANLYNGYGPTETTVYSTIKKITSNDDVNIGKPISNTQIYILGKSMNPVPIGVKGEIYIGGEGVGNGYINKKNLTSERYLPNTFTGKGMMYRTGDLAKWLPTGDIHFIGRKDYQVKLRGLRIELGEIENTMISYHGIEKAIAMIREVNGNQSLNAYIVCKKNINLTDLRAFMSNKLPVYMVPSYFIKLDKLPLTPNGKIDRNALLKMNRVIQSKVEFEPPINKTEVLLLKVWRAVLKADKISVNDNFFEIGGDSLAVIQVQSRLYHYKFGLNTQDFYKYQTIRKMSGYIDSKQLYAACTVDERNRFRIFNNDFYKFIAKPDENRCEYSSSNNIMLTGATGFLGIHILHRLLHTNKEIYCIVRRKNNKQARSALLKLLRVYFCEDYENLPVHRLHVLCGDIAKKFFGCSSDEFYALGGKVDAVIHAAANTKHYGNYKDFFMSNVRGTQHVAEFCLKNKAFLYHISTMSILGESLQYDYGVKRPFTEKHFYVGQNYADNVYVRSKFEAERLVYKLSKYGLRASVLRVGFLTGRAIDGFCQLNVQENSFYNRLRAMIHIKAIPKDLQAMDMEFTPVDYCSLAIEKLISFDNTGKVYHLCNHHTITFRDLIQILSKMGINIDVEERNIFDNIVTKYTNNINILLGLNEYFNISSKSGVYSDNTYSSILTRNFLNPLDFEWPKIDERYIGYILRYIKDKKLI